MKHRKSLDAKSKSKTDSASTNTSLAVSTASSELDIVSSVSGSVSDGDGSLGLETKLSRQIDQRILDKLGRVYSIIDTLGGNRNVNNNDSSFSAPSLVPSDALQAGGAGGGQASLGIEKCEALRSPGVVLESMDPPLLPTNNHLHNIQNVIY